jgi:dihydrofolate synthase/folylpolyglutamate synthase
MRFGLDAVRAVDHAMGRPGADARVIQVVGTNGKGSTAALIAHGLTHAPPGAGAAGVGLYTSPHLHRVGERVRLDGRPVDDARIEAAVADVLRFESAAPRPLSFFEVITLAAWRIFASVGARDWVLEAGLGGRLDATTAREPALVVVTPIGLDHQQFLGETLEAIAAEKAAVFRPGVPVITAPQPPSVRDVLFTRAMEVGAPLHTAAPAERPPQTLPGAHQATNAGVALAALRCLGRSPALENFDDAQWPARAEVLTRGAGEVVLDVAHNPAGARALATWLASRESRGSAGVENSGGPRRCVLVLGVRDDKPVATIQEALRAVSGELWCGRVFEHSARIAASDREYDDIDALVAAVEASAYSGQTVVVTGSHQLVGPVRARLLGISDAADRGLTDPSRSEPA